MSRLTNKVLCETYVLITVFFNGAAVLFVEIMGTRILTPFYGSTIFVWSSMITVTLAFLSVGYFFGGIVADRKNDPFLLYFFTFLAGLSIFTLYQYKGFILLMSDRFGFRFGPLVAASLLFSIPFSLMGMISPYAIKLVSSDIGRIGTKTGLIFGVSSIGSLAGALLCGFYLIRFLPTEKILYIMVMILTGLGAMGMLLHRGDRGFRGNKKLVLLLLPCIVGICFRNYAMYTTTNAGQSLMFSAENEYGQIQIIDFTGDEGARFLTVDNFGQSSIKVSSRDRRSYIPHMAMPVSDLQPGSNILLLGLGGGQILTDFDRVDLQWDIVELNHDIVSVATRYMGLELDSRRHRLFIEDARLFLRQHPEPKYELILVDLYNGFSVPYPMLSDEALMLLKSRLTKNGLIAIHIIGKLTTDDHFVTTFLTTANGVFEDVIASSDDEEHLNPIVVFMANEMIDMELYNQKVDSRNLRFQMDKGPFKRDLPFGTTVYRDEHNIAEFLWQENTEELRKRYMKAFVKPYVHR